MNVQRQRVLRYSFLVFGFLLGGAGFVQNGNPAKDSTSGIQNFVKKYCGECHNSERKRGGVVLTGPLTSAQIVANASRWQSAMKQIQTKQMPPEGMPQPSAAERTKVLLALEEVMKGDCATAEAGHVTLRRLNRAEYNNTIRDLFGIAYSPANDFPSDDVGHGFDNIGEVLSTSPLLVEKLISAAEKVAAKVVIIPTARTQRIPGSDLTAPAGGNPQGAGYLMFTNGLATAKIKIPSQGKYLFRAGVFANQAGPDLAKACLVLNKQYAPQKEVPATNELALTILEESAVVKPGTYELGVAFVNDYYEPDNPDPKKRDRNLEILWVEVVGPISETKLPYSHKQLFAPAAASKPADRAKAILVPFMTRAYRRPVETQELNAMLKLVNLAEKQGESFERGIQLAVTATLASPNFVFRPEPTEGKKLTEYQLASRLSYFLWSSMPDDILLALAEQNMLSKPAVLSQQVARMLADPKSAALAENFASQWLGLRKLEIVHPDPKQFPEVTDVLKNDFANESLTFFNQLIQKDRSIYDVLDARYSYLNDRLARYYGLSGVSGSEFQYTKLPEGVRGGILTHASVLTLTSNPNRTSPVKRGKWVLENILGTPPPPPPPNVGVLQEEHAGTIPKSVRERLAAHVKDPSCAACHKKLDPIGLAMEQYNAAGKRIDADASAELPDGQKLNGDADLRKYLVSKKEVFARAFSEKLLTYALGRGLTVKDQCAVDEVVQKAASQDQKLTAIILAIVQSRPFLNQGPDPKLEK